MDNRIVQTNRNYTSLLCYQKSLVIYDLTYHFCERFLDKRDRTYDQMLQAARSGKQNIVEGTVDKSTSYEMMIKLLNVSRGSLAELKEDYMDYIRTRGLRLWEASSKEVEAMRRLGVEHSESHFFCQACSDTQRRDGCKYDYCAFASGRVADNEVYKIC